MCSYCTLSAGLAATTPCWRRPEIGSAPNGPVEAAKHLDDGKLPYQHLPMEGLKLAAQVNQFGAKKYGQDNWRGGMAWMRILGSCMRHLIAFIGGENLDPESGLSHVGHLIFDAMMLAEYLKTHGELDDRPAN